MCACMKFCFVGLRTSRTNSKFLVIGLYPTLCHENIWAQTITLPLFGKFCSEICSCTYKAHWKCNKKLCRFLISLHVTLPYIAAHMLCQCRITHLCVICSAVNERYDLFVDGDLNTAVAGLTALACQGRSEYRTIVIIEIKPNF